MKIELIRQGVRGIALATIDNEKAGMMTLTFPSDKLIIIDHTEVDQKHKGKELGKMLLDKVVDLARKEKREIIPLCPFANAMFKKWDHIKDVLKK